MTIVLASASPRRRDILGGAGLSFDVRVAGVDETLLGAWEPEAAALELARRKARAIAGRVPPLESRWVIGADTVVAVALEQARWDLLGKPADAAAARAMLCTLSGSRHRVVTGVCVIRTLDGEERARAETTWVTMRPISAAEVEAYVRSEEWRDKAGGYAIQESADAFVTSLEGGGFDNVVGLPLGLTLELLGELGAPLSGG